jgi:hypothetical protein
LNVAIAAAYALLDVMEKRAAVVEADAMIASSVARRS